MYRQTREDKDTSKTKGENNSLPYHTMRLTPKTRGRPSLTGRIHVDGRVERRHKAVARALANTALGCPNPRALFPRTAPPRKETRQGQARQNSHQFRSKLGSQSQSHILRYRSAHPMAGLLPLPLPRRPLSQSSSAPSEDEMMR